MLTGYVRVKETASIYHCMAEIIRSTRLRVSPASMVPFRSRSKLEKKHQVHDSALCPVSLKDLQWHVTCRSRTHICTGYSLVFNLSPCLSGLFLLGHQVVAQSMFIGSNIRVYFDAPAATRSEKEGSGIVVYDSTYSTNFAVKYSLM
jgi:hypothetical protein